jgi:hypothetical protein
MFKHVKNINAFGGEGTISNIKYKPWSARNQNGRLIKFSHTHIMTYKFIFFF